MSRTGHSFFRLLVVLLPLLVESHSLLMNHYRRPVCAEHQSCSYTINRMELGLCDCPGPNPECPEEGYTVEQTGVDYKFCSERQMHMCSPGEVAQKVNNLVISLFCICPEHMNLVSKPPKDSIIKNYTCEFKQPEISRFVSYKSVVSYTEATTMTEGGVQASSTVWGGQRCPLNNFVRMSSGFFMCIPKPANQVPVFHFGPMRPKLGGF